MAFFIAFASDKDANPFIACVCFPLTVCEAVVAVIARRALSFAFAGIFVAERCGVSRVKRAFAVACAAVGFHARAVFTCMILPAVAVVVACLLAEVICVTGPRHRISMKIAFLAVLVGGATDALAVVADAGAPTTEGAIVLIFAFVYGGLGFDGDVLTTIVVAGLVARTVCIKEVAVEAVETSQFFLARDASPSVPVAFFIHTCIVFCLKSLSIFGAIEFKKVWLFRAAI